MTIKKILVPHKARNRFMHDGAASVSVTASSGSGSGAVAESDPIFSASPAAHLTDEMISILSQMHLEDDETISVDLGFFSRSFLSAYGENSGGGGGGGGGIGVTITGTGNAVTNAVYDSANALLRLTKGNLQSVISDLATIRSNADQGATAYGWGDHASAGYAAASTLTSHTSNTTKHITSTERTTWNKKYAKPSGGIPNSDLTNSSMTLWGTSVSLGDTRTGNMSGVGTISASGSMTITKKTDEDIAYNAVRTDSDGNVTRRLFFGIGSGGVNSGIWDYQKNYWVFLATTDYVGINNNKVVILDGGNVGIGTSSPSERLHVSGTSTQQATLYTNSNANVISGVEANGTAILWNRSNKPLRLGTNATERMRITEDGKVGIGTTSPSQKLHVSGNILATGAITAYTTSDERLKDNIREVDCLSLIKSLGGVKQFDYKEDGKHSVGLIAQNLEQSELRDAVYEREDGYKAVNYLDPRMVSLALGAADQLRRENEELKARVERLEKMVEQLITDKI